MIRTARTNEGRQGYFCCRRCWQQSQEEHLSQDVAGISVPQGIHVQNQGHPLSSLHYPTRILLLSNPHVQEPFTGCNLVQPQNQQNHITMKKTSNLCQKGEYNQYKVLWVSHAHEIIDRNGPLPGDLFYVAGISIRLYTRHACSCFTKVK